MKKLFLLLTFSVALFGCAGMGVKRDYDTSVDFTRLKTYAWQPSKDIVADPDDNSLMEARVQKAVDASLAEKGLRKASPGETDCLVSYQYTVERQTDAGNIHSGVGLGGGSGGLFGGLSIGLGSGSQDNEYENLAIAIIDPKTGKLMWQGSTRKQLTSSTDPDKTTKRINTEIKDILSKFPPK